MTNHGPDAATLHVLPPLWFRNTWAEVLGRLGPELRQWLTQIALLGAGRRAAVTSRGQQGPRQRSS
ncbi:MAG: hypothetical protein ABI807_06400 [Sporichthyaceae bacterium]